MSQYNTATYCLLMECVEFEAVTESSLEGLPLLQD